MAHIEKKTSKNRRTGKIATKWQARYTGPDGRERSKRFDRKVDAEAWVATNCGDIVRGEWLDPGASRVVFREWADTWAATTVGLRPSTRQQNLDYLRRYILPTFGNLTLGQ